MKKILLLLLSLCSIFVTAQEEASNWYFGENAGISFNPVDGSITNLNNGQLATREGCSSISDSDGNLLFYTDGTTVYNKNHTVMNNGLNLMGDESSTQSAIVVPKPEDPNIYYIFTVGSNQNPTGLKYSVVDMTLAGGLGAIIQKNVNLLNQCSEKISAVLKDCNSGEIWVVTLANEFGNAGIWDTIYAFEVSSAGVNATPVKTVVSLNITDSRGYLKLSPDGTWLACANVQSGMYLFDFDSQTGTVSNTRQLSISSTANKPYGVEFSPDSSILYVSASNDYPSNAADGEDPENHRSVLVQYNLYSTTTINASQTIIDDRALFRGGLQLGPDGKIYRAISKTYQQGSNFLGAINNPNVLGMGCDYLHTAVSLGNNNSTQGLPPFIQSFFNQKIDIINNPNSTSNTNNLPLCIGESYTLSIEPSPGATYTWSMDGNVLPETDHDLVVTQPGFYELYVELSGGECETLEGEANVTYHDYPIANTQADVVICDDNNDGSWTFNLTQFDAAILGTQDPNDFTVKYYSTLEHAENDTNELFANYPNASNPQQIFARVSNNGNTNCYDISSFQIEVFNTPSAPTIGDLIVCDDGSDGDATNGQTAIQLSDFDADVYNGQDTTAYTITYHSSQADADAGTGELPSNYYNQTPFNETIFARIENNLSSDCYSTTSINLEINPIPDAFDASLVQCDEDGIPDGQTLFNFYEIVDAITGGAADRLVTFYASQNDANNNQNALDGTAYSNLSNPQTIYVTVTNSLTGCSDMAELTLEVSMTQINDYIAPAVCDEIDSEDGINPFDLDAIANDMLLGLPANLDLSFYETYEDALLEQNALTSPYTNTTPYSQVLFARAENNNACYGISEVTLTVNPLPQLLEDETSYYCLNTFPEYTTLEGGVINDLPNNYYYEWSTGATTSFIQINQAGTYSVTVTNTLGCSKTRTITVEDSNIATFETIEVVDGSASFNNIVNVLVSGEGTYQFALANSNGIYLPYQDSPIFENVFPGIYTVLVRDVKNDCGIVEDLVSVIGFPKFFTPNNDGSHDTWQVYGIADQFQPNSKILIFDRYGKLLKELDPLGRGWDGTLNGEPMPTSDYWFAVTLQDGRLFKSHFTLKR